MSQHGNPADDRDIRQAVACFRDTAQLTAHLGVKPDPAVDAGDYNLWAEQRDDLERALAEDWDLIGEAAIAWATDQPLAGESWARLWETEETPA